MDFSVQHLTATLLYFPFPPLEMIMSPRRVSMCVAVAFFVVFSASALLLHAQTLPAATAADQMGLQLYQSYHGGDIDHINLMTGTLDLNVPFLSYPQRGSLSASFNIIYNTEQQHFSFEKLVADPGYDYEYYWNYPLENSPFPVEKGGVSVASMSKILVIGTPVASGSTLTANWYV